MDACVSLCYGITSDESAPFSFDRVRASTAVCRIQLDDANALPEDTNIHPGDLYQAYCTAGTNCACGVHGIFGAPNGEQFYCADARKVAQKLLGPTYAAVTERLGHAAMLNFNLLCDFLWSDLLLPFFSRRKRRRNVCFRRSAAQPRT